MDSIFPGFGPNPFKAVGVVESYNPARKAQAPSAPKPADAYPSQVEKAAAKPDKATYPGRGWLIDYSA